MTNFSEKIKKYREENKLTQNDFAEKLHVSRQAVSKWENGISYPNYEILAEIATMLETTVDDLLSKEEIVKETVNGKQRNKRNIVLIIILAIAAFISVSIGIVAMVIAVTNRNSAELVEEETREYLGVFLYTKTLNDEGTWKESTTVEEFQSLKYPGVFKKNKDDANQVNRASKSTKMILNDDEKTYETGFAFCGNGYLFRCYVFQDLKTNEILIEEEVVGYLYPLANISFSVLFNQITYNYSFDILYETNAKETKVIEYNNEFKQIKETVLDYSKLEKEYPYIYGMDHKVSDECLYIVIENQFEDKLDKSIIWRENMPTSATIYHTDDFVFSSYIRFNTN